LRHQLLHDLKASWQKSLLLGVLLVVGLFFWIPPLVRAMVGETRPSASREAADAQGVGADGNFAGDVALRGSAGETSRSITWQRADAFLNSDPLVRSAEVAAIQAAPFRVNPDQFAPPILFADATGAKGKQSAPPKSASVPKPADAASTEPAEKLPEGLVLKSTIVGERRRAALINETLYVEGSVIQVDGTSYLLAAVHPRQVELRRGEQVFVLGLPGFPSNDRIRIERAQPETATP